jgi:hypothetical protein
MTRNFRGRNQWKIPDRLKHCKLKGVYYPVAHNSLFLNYLLAELRPILFRLDNMASMKRELDADNAEFDVRRPHGRNKGSTENSILNCKWCNMEFKTVNASPVK